MQLTEASNASGHMLSLRSSWSNISNEWSSANLSKMLQPWVWFEKSWYTTTGYPVDQFRFTPGETPMATLQETIAGIVVYYAVILSTQELMRGRPPMKLTNLFLVHNFYLTFISGALLTLFMCQLIPSMQRNTFLNHLCGAAGHTQPLSVLYYLNYLTKYLELLDTLFLVLRKKQLTFLHTYHHGATVLLCYTQLRGATSMSWIPVTLNLTVHVVMYWYYFQAARGVKIWWKKYITIFQIIQFVLDLGFVWFTMYTHFAHQYAPWLPNMGKCGEKHQEVAGWLGTGILSSYLLLFALFYRSTYKTPRTASRSTHNPKAKSS